MTYNGESAVLPRHYDAAPSRNLNLLGSALLTIHDVLGEPIERHELHAGDMFEVGVGVAHSVRSLSDQRVMWSHVDAEPTH